MAVADRVERLRAHLRDGGLDALVVTNPENRRYLSGFTGHDDGADSAGTLLIGLSELALITDGRYAEQAAAECAGPRVVVRQDTWPPLVVESLHALAARRVGIEATHLTVALRDDLAAAADKHAHALELVSTTGLVEALRVVKDAEEVASIERAVAITDETFAYLLTYLRPGLTEREVAGEIERVMRAHGAEGLAFAPIVAGGANAARPHAVPTDRPLAAGETIIIDMGARYAGYCSDMTRTVCLGEATDEMRAVYAAVLRAQQACEDGLRPGMTGHQADALARDALAATGRAEQFIHGTGHGLGLEIHEAPRIGRFGAENVLVPGMVVTVEPGAYISGWGGVRIEDTVVLTDRGSRVLTRSPKTLVLPPREPRTASAPPGVV
ncbi:MAG: Xaa-Pro peptidase family protein [Ktedonobacterales bacterium]